MRVFRARGFRSSDGSGVVAKSRSRRYWSRGMADFECKLSAVSHASGDVESGAVRPSGHPPGLSTLFFTELWERFSYYGMRALLVLFMTDLVANGGLGMTVVTATAIYGLYTFAVYAVALPGGWIADRLIGQRQAVLIGGVIIAVGHLTLAIPTLTAFYLGLVLIVLGTGLLKPNVSAIVADLYPEGGARRDAGFSIFYMGINVGALAGPLVCGTLGERINWHLGFSAAGVGMILGVVLVELLLTSTAIFAAGSYWNDPSFTNADGTTDQRATETILLLLARNNLPVVAGCLVLAGSIAIVFSTPISRAMSISDSSTPT